ncbi:DUF1722 domain-containing protein [candidate division KSB1 bacterium]|nr:DUF523 and DUF1722 domain-containing protein [candidate division KSB1 bacterium]RQW01836.1 MAG: DUF1722 domain-containing protein [candidate division KSB1 bacterium]
MKNDRIKLGISSCLLGEKVRYDGGHKLDRYLVNVVGPFVDWIPICPEVECGLPIPRESMRLVQTGTGVRLLTGKSKIDHTERMLRWIDKRLDLLEQENTCGFIFKAKSPSSGMRDVKIYGENGMPVGKGAGLFASMLMQRFPHLPVEDEGRLNDAGLRENFIERVFVYHRWRKYLANGASRKELVNFHTDHKLLLMAHSEKHMRVLGKLVAAPQTRDKDDLNHDYFVNMMEGLKLKATVKKNVNVLQHIVGYFKKQLTAAEKQEVLQVIDLYHQHLIPLIVPVTLLKHFVNKYDESYLKRQYYLNPHPAELMLRNHV